MSLITCLIIGTAIIILGFRAYSYFDKNIESIDNAPWKLIRNSSFITLNRNTHDHLCRV